MEQERITDIISSSSDALATVDGIITSIYKSHMRKYERADSYLETVILEKGFASDKDVETAARLYGIPMLHKKYRNIAKTLNKADALCKKRSSDNEVFYCFRDRELEEWFNITREEILKVLSSVCREARIRELHFMRRRYYRGW